MLLAIVVLLLFVLAFLAVAETALNRISRVQGAGDRRLAGTKRRRGRCCASSATRSGSSTRCSSRSPCCRRARRSSRTLLADRLFGAKGVVVGFVLNVVVFFVLAEAMPKTWAVLSAERAALLTARPHRLARVVPAAAPHQPRR